MSDAAPRSFDAATLAGLPDAARRYLQHAIAPDTPIAARVDLETDFRMRLRPGAAPASLVGRERLEARRFEWNARFRHGRLPARVRDRYAGGSGKSGVWLFGWIPVAWASGPDLTRSARGRLAIESIWLPSVLLPRAGTRWEPGVDGLLRVVRTIDGEAIPLRLRVDQTGRLREVTFERWGNVGTSGWQLIPFGVSVEDEETFGGYTIPTVLRGGWWYGTARSPAGDAALFRVRSADFGA